MAIENTDSSNFDKGLSLVKSDFDCRIPGVSLRRRIVIYSKCSKISKTFLRLFSNKMFVSRAGIHKMLVKITNREDPDQCDQGLHSLSKAFR